MGGARDAVGTRYIREKAPDRSSSLARSPLSLSLSNVLRVRSGEALAVSAVAQLHRLLAADNTAGGRGRGHVPGSSFLTPVQIIARSSPSSFGELLERELNTRLQLSPDS